MILGVNNYIMIQIYKNTFTDLKIVKIKKDAFFVWSGLDARVEQQNNASFGIDFLLEPILFPYSLNRQ